MLEGIITFGKCLTQKAELGFFNSNIANDIACSDMSFGVFPLLATTCHPVELPNDHSVFEVVSLGDIDAGRRSQRARVVKTAELVIPAYHPTSVPHTHNTHTRRARVLRRVRRARQAVRIGACCWDGPTLPPAPPSPGSGRA